MCTHGDFLVLPHWKTRLPASWPDSPLSHIILTLINGSVGMLGLMGVGVGVGVSGCECSGWAGRGGFSFGVGVWEWVSECWGGLCCFLRGCLFGRCDGER